MWSDRHRLGLLACCSVTVALAIPAMRWPGDPLDESILLVQPLRMLDGALPYRDFTTAYGPMHWWLLEAVFLVAPATLTTLRLVGLALHVALVAGIWKLSDRLDPRWAAPGGLVAAALLSLLGNAPYAWVTVTALVVWQLVLLTRPPGDALWHVTSAGLLAGLAVSIRPDTVLLALVPAIPALRSSARWKAWGVGLALGLAPLGLAFLLTPGDMIRDLVLGRATRGAGGSRLDLLPPLPEEQALLALVLASVLLAAVARTVRTPLSAPLTLLGALALPQMLQRADGTHVVYAGLLCLPFAPALLGRACRPRYPAVAAVAVLALVLSPTVWDALRQQKGIPVTNAGRELLVRPVAVTELRRVVGSLAHLPSHTRLFVFDRDLRTPLFTEPALYYLLPDLEQRAHNVELMPGLSSAPEFGLVEDVRDADVVVLVTVPDDRRRQSFPHARPGGHAAAELLAREFCLRQQLRFHAVYTRCANPMPIAEIGAR